MGKKINSPVKNGIAKVPVVMQLEALECGAACLTMVLEYYGKWIPLEQVRGDCGVSRDGSNALNITKAARYYGLTANGYKLEPETLKEAGSYPCIVHWNFNHFIVVKGFKNGKVYVNDPAKGDFYMSEERFDEGFTGICIFFEPSENFVPSGSQKSMITYVKNRIRGIETPIIFTGVVSVITSILGIIVGLLDRVYYDRLLTGSNPEWFIPFMTVMAVVFLTQILVSIVSVTTNLKISGKVNVVGNLTYMWKVLHLPIGFFSQRMTGDIVSRQNSNAMISDTLINTFAPLLLNTVMMIFYLVIMIKYSWVLTLIGVISIIVNMFISNYISKKRINISRVISREASKLYATTISGVQMIETIKSSGAEEGYFEKWSGNTASYNLANQKYIIENSKLGILYSSIYTLTSVTILGMGVYLVLKGEFTLGMITAFQGFFLEFSTPANELISAGQEIQEMRTEMERLEDVMQYPSDPCSEFKGTGDGDSSQKLSGNIDINNVSFSYSKLGKPMIKNLSLSVKQGQSVAIVGPSGCGKSTIAKLVSGLYFPQEGEILFDGKKISEIDHSIFTGSVAVVDQDIVLFEDSIENNIKMWDNSIENFEMILASRDAMIHSDIMAKKDGYYHKLTEGGKDLSGGQRQRMEIARVLSQDPTIIILDEATSALDANTEYEVVKAIKDRGITCIVVAHRLSTIRDCDQILVLNKGEVIERGTHEELMKLNGQYTQLITNE